MESSSSMVIRSGDIRCFEGVKYDESKVLAMRASFPGEDDETLARFLIARGGDMDKARVMLTEHLEWRSEQYYNINSNILKSGCLGEIMKGKVYINGVDKEGHPLVVFRPKFNDAAVRDIDEMGRMAIWWTEVIVSEMENFGGTCLYDL